MDMINFSPRRAICAGLVAMGLSVTALAAQPLSTGLGQAWPNAQDVSASAQWHVYVFANGGIQFVQVNDLAGNVRAAVGAVNGQFLVLPMGRDAVRISTPQQPLSIGDTVVPLTSYTQTIYRDATVQLDAIPLSDGTTMFKAAAPGTATTMGAPTCDDPAVCNTHLK
jgi:hypothetical protein